MTMRKLSLIALALVVSVPLTLEAQRGGGGGSRRGLGAGGGADEADRLIRDMAESPSLSKDLQKANPLEILLDSKKDLKITSDEEKELKTLNNSLKDAIKPFLKTIDSVSREMKKTGEYEPTQGQRVVGRQITREASDSVMMKYRAASQDAVSKLAEERRQPATELLQQQMQAQMGARRGGRPPM